MPAGLMQLMPATYNEVVKKHNLPSDLNAETANITAGSYYYSGLKRYSVIKTCTQLLLTTAESAL